MRPGFAFRVEEGAAKVGVIFTAHFVERYEVDLPTRAAAKRKIQEAEIYLAIRKAIPTIQEWVEAGYEPDGLIRVVATGMNMSFSVTKTRQGFTLAMKNIMVKRGYEPGSLKDYVIDINPQVTIRFMRKMDRDLKVAVVDHLLGQIPRLEPEATYEMETPEAKYVVDIGESGELYIEDAEWLSDMLLVDVR